MFLLLASVNPKHFSNILQPIRQFFHLEWSRMTVKMWLWERIALRILVAGCYPKCILELLQNQAFKWHQQCQAHLNGQCAWLYLWIHPLVPTSTYFQMLLPPHHMYHLRAPPLLWYHVHLNSMFYFNKMERFPSTRPILAVIELCKRRYNLTFCKYPR